jgi:broad specificity phosphatase PhoE
MESKDSFIEQREKAKPELIIDFIRHGQTAYGLGLKEKISGYGQNLDTYKLMPIIDEGIEDPREQLEGRITVEGEAGLRASVQKLATEIDGDNEIVVIVHGERTRHEHSTDIIADEFKKLGVSISKVRQHKHLTDMKGEGWPVLIDYVINHQGKEEADLEAFWWEMYQNPETRAHMKELGFESLEAVSERYEVFIKLLRRFVERYTLGKTLRVIAVTSDIGMGELKQRGVPLEKRDQLYVKNGEVIEFKEFIKENE